MTRLAFRLAAWAPSLVLATAMACATRPASMPVPAADPMVSPPAVMSDADAAIAFRALLDEVIGDSADRVCLSIAVNGTDADPSTAVMHALTSHAPTHVLPHSDCVADERNFGNPHGLLTSPRGVFTSMSIRSSCTPRRSAITRRATNAWSRWARMDSVRAAGSPSAIGPAVSRETDWKVRICTSGS